MNKLFTLLLIFVCSHTAFSQITVGSNHFPVVGDTWYIATDSFPPTFITPPGPDYFWDYSNLVPQQNVAFTVQDISSTAFAADFPDADVVLPFLDGQGFYKVNSDSVELIGYFGTPAGGLGSLPLLVEMDPPGTILYANMEYGDVFYDTSSFYLEIDATEIPPDAELPFDISDIDSARIDVTIIQKFTVDSWGKCRTALGDFQVLRVKETQNRNTRVEVKHNFLNWFDLSVFPIDGIGQELYENYRFIDDVSKEPIFYAETRDGSINPYYVEWKVDPTAVSIEEAANPIEGLMAYPNPAANQINIAVRTSEPGDYQISIINLLGRTMLVQPFFSGTETELQVNLEGMAQGIYLYSILNDQGEILETKRFLISRP
ncbi:MAG: T9SS type A sorting domain-containing protein [Bacteroidota bacterium]